MKESYGGTFMLWLFLFFLIVYITILCSALQFAKTYRVKNKIVNMIEQNKYNINKEPSSLDDDLGKYFASVPYVVDENHMSKKKKECDAKNSDDEGNTNSHWFSGTCITKLQSNDSAVYYEVEVYFIVEIPILFEGGITIPIKGETTRIFIND